MKYTLVCASDWEGLYEDGKLIMQTHVLHTSEVFYRTGMGDVINLTKEQDKALCEQGSLPDNLVDLDKLK